MKTPDLIVQLRNIQRNALVWTSLLVCLMMVCLMAGVQQLGQRLSPGWNGSYLLVIAVLFSLESLLTRKTTTDLDFRERVIFHLSEWVAFAVMIKLLIYLTHGFQGIMQDLRSWQASFYNFFTLEYLLALILAFSVWISSRSYAGEIDELFDREQDATWDDLGKLQNALNQIRGKIINRVFLQGALLVAMAAFTRMEASWLLRQIGVHTPGYQAPVINILVYFVIALALLSQTQFALLRTRWTWLRLPFSATISRNWIKFSLVFFGVLSLLVFFLPTEYSLGLFDTLQGLTNLLMQAALFLLMLISLPFTLCMRLFAASNNADQQNTNLEPAQPFMPPPVESAASAPFPWLAFLRSLFFWIVFITVIILAVSYYVRQNAALWNSIQAFPLARWFSRAWQSLRVWLAGANRQVAKLVKNGIEQVRLRRLRPSVTNIKRLFDVRRLSPRDKVIYYFVNLTQLSGERGVDRRPNQTPYDYENNLGQALPDTEPDLHSLTEAFYEARYSQHLLDEPQAAKASNLWTNIKAVLLKKPNT